jgi:hypothetical protein
MRNPSKYKRSPAKDDSAGQYYELHHFCLGAVKPRCAPLITETSSALLSLRFNTRNLIGCECEAVETINQQLQLLLQITQEA